MAWALPAPNVQHPEGTSGAFSKLPISGWGEPPARGTSFSWGTPKGAEDNWIRPRSLGCNSLGYSEGALMDEGWSVGAGKAVPGDGGERGDSGDRHRVPLHRWQPVRDRIQCLQLMGKGQDARQVLPKASPRMEAAGRSQSNCCPEKYGVTYLLRSLTRC